MSKIYTKGDFHVHSFHSDGELSPKELIDGYKTAGYDILALTDHDTIGGCDDAIAYGKKVGLRIVPGIELSTKFRGEDVHILGYFGEDNYNHPKIIDFMKRKEDSRRLRCKTMCEKLDEHFGVKIDAEKIISESIGCIGRPHIVQHIIEAGYESDYETCFKRFMGNDSPAYTPSSFMAPDEGISLLREVGAVVILAHPVLIKGSTVEELVQMFDFDGIEAIYTANTSEQTDSFLKTANDEGLLVTAGSDFHRACDRKHGQIGDIWLSGDYLHRLILRTGIECI